MQLIIGDKALAAKLGVSERTIRNLNKKGKLNAARYRRGIRGNAYDFDKVLEILKY